MKYITHLARIFEIVSSYDNNQIKQQIIDD